jgi:hypothetical protein
MCRRMGFENLKRDVARGGMEERKGSERCTCDCLEEGAGESKSKEQRAKRKGSDDLTFVVRSSVSSGLSTDSIA